MITNEGPDTIVNTGSEAFLGGEWAVYGLKDRAALFLIASYS
jgi:hypothetical protein